MAMLTKSTSVTGSKKNIIMRDTTFRKGESSTRIKIVPRTIKPKSKGFKNIFQPHDRKVNVPVKTQRVNVPRSKGKKSKFPIGLSRKKVGVNFTALKRGLL